MTKEEALGLLEEHVKTEVLRFHCLESAAIMKGLARKLGEDEALWEITGLLHDLDFEKTKEVPERHALETLEILKERDLPPEALEAIKMHNAEALGLGRAGKFAHALAAVETLTGLIVASALVQPDKRIASVKAKSVKKKMRDKSFARNVNREIIKECEKLGLELSEFIELSLESMGEIAAEVGL